MDAVLCANHSKKDKQKLNSIATCLATGSRPGVRRISRRIKWSVW